MTEISVEELEELEPGSYRLIDIRSGRDEVVDELVGTLQKLMK